MRQAKVRRTLFVGFLLVALSLPIVRMSRGDICQDVVWVQLTGKLVEVQQDGQTLPLDTLAVIPLPPVVLVAPTGWSESERTVSVTDPYHFGARADFLVEGP
jgi:hypothetical protein